MLEARSPPPLGEAGWGEFRFDPERHHRQPVWLNGYGYSLAGAYFLAICTPDRVALFGDIVGDEMRLNDTSCMVAAVWNQLPDHHPAVDVDAFVVMTFTCMV